MLRLVLEGREAPAKGILRPLPNPAPPPVQIRVSSKRPPRLPSASGWRRAVCRSESRAAAVGSGPTGQHFLSFFFFRAALFKSQTWSIFFFVGLSRKLGAEERGPGHTLTHTRKVLGDDQGNTGKSRRQETKRAPLSTDTAQCPQATSPHAPSHSVHFLGGCLQCRNPLGPNKPPAS